MPVLEGAGRPLRWQGGQVDDGVGGEALGALAVAVHPQVPVGVLAEMIYAYPTFHRAIEDAITRLS